MSKFNPNSNSGKFNGGNSGLSNNTSTPNKQRFSSVSSFNKPEPEEPKKEKPPRKPINKKKLYTTLAILSVLAGSSYGAYYKYIDTGLPKQINYADSKDNFFSQLKSSWGTEKDPKTYSTSMYASKVKSPYLNKEIDYFNRDKNKMKFFQFILSQTKFIPEKDNLKTRQGKEVFYLSDYTDNKYTFKIPDYDLIQKRALTKDYSAIQQVYKQRNLNKKDYNYSSELTQLFIDYIMSLKELPTKTVTVSLDLNKSGNGYILDSDKNLDNLLFASKSFQSLQDTVSAISNGDIGELKDNPEYSKWKTAKENYDKQLTDKISEKIKAEKSDSSDETKGSSDKKDEDTSKYKTDNLKSSDSMLDDRTQKLIDEADKKEKQVKQQLSQDATKYEKDLYTNMQLEKDFYSGIKFEQDTPKDGQFVIKDLTDSSNDENNSSSNNTENELKVIKDYKDKLQNQTKALNDLKKSIDDLTSSNKTDKATQDKIKSQQKQLDDLVLQEEVDETKKDLIEKEQSRLSKQPGLTAQEKAIGLEPPIKVFIREQVPNTDWGTWNQMKTYVSLPEPPKTVNKPLQPQQNIEYTWIGAYNLQNDYKDKSGNKQKINPQVGDGSFKYPSTLGTTVQTKAYDKKGNLHDVKIILEKVVVGDDAIKYTQNLDERNQGFDTTSDSKLVAVEYRILNLEDLDQTLVSGFQLSDKDGNPIARNGQMYSIKNELNIKAHSSDTMQDWFYTKDPESLYLVWGKDQDKKDFKWFDTLQFQTKKTSTDTDQ